MLAVIGASGKIGAATLDALISYNLLSASNIVACTSSQPGSPTWKRLQSKDVQVRHATFEDKATLEEALHGCIKLYLVSTPHVHLDYNDAKPGSGREKHHIAAIDAARRAGIEHIYYTSLAFGDPSKAGVMQAHLRTEAYLSSLPDLKITVLREGLYSESWPLYLGYYDQKADSREQVLICGDGKISWTAIDDLGLANALIISAPSSSYAGKSLYLANGPEAAKSVAEVATLVAKARNRQVSVQETSGEEYISHYVNVRGMDAASVRWWSTTYEALKDGECLIKESPLVSLLAEQGRRPILVEATIKTMLG